MGSVSAFQDSSRRALFDRANKWTEQISLACSGSDFYDKPLPRNNAGYLNCIGPYLALNGSNFDGKKRDRKLSSRRFRWCWWFAATRQCRRPNSVSQFPTPRCLGAKNPTPVDWFLMYALFKCTARTPETRHFQNVNPNPQLALLQNASMSVHFQ